MPPPTPTERPLRRALRDYLVGLAWVAAGAGLSAWTGSFLPLALAASAALMRTAALVRQIAGARRRRDPRADDPRR